MKKNKSTRATKKTNKKQEAGVMAVIPYSEIEKPEMYKGKYTLAPTPFTEKQILAIIAPTPRQIIKKRPGKGGGQWDYVPGWWFKKKLNFVFGFSHDFEIVGERVDGDFITVKGKITVKHPKTGQILASKTDFGGAAIKYKKGTKTYLDIPNDFKAAATDAFKRCAVQLGFAMDIYGKNESTSEGYEIIENNGRDKQAAIKGRPATPAEAKKIKAVVVNASEPVADHLTQVKARLVKLGAKNETEAIKILKERTGLIWKSFKVTPTQAQIALGLLLNSNK